MRSIHNTFDDTSIHRHIVLACIHTNAIRAHIYNVYEKKRFFAPIPRDRMGCCGYPSIKTESGISVLLLFPWLHFCFCITFYRAIYENDRYETKFICSPFFSFFLCFFLLSCPLCRIFSLQFIFCIHWRFDFATSVWSGTTSSTLFIHRVYECYSCMSSAIELHFISLA